MDKCDNYSLIFKGGSPVYHKHKINKIAGVTQCFRVAVSEGEGLTTEQCKIFKLKNLKQWRLERKGSEAPVIANSE